MNEQRLRDALHGEVDDVHPDVERAWANVRRRSTRRRPRPALFAAAALVLAVGLGAFVLDRDDDGTVDLVPAGEGDPVATTTTVRAEEPEMAAFWPFDSMDEVDAYVADPGVGMFFDPEATALEFAREYLAMPDPVAVDGFHHAEGQSGWVDVRSKPSSAMVTTVWVHRYGGEDGAYAVYFAETDNIDVNREHLAGPQGTTIDLAGQSTAFEAHVDVEVRDLDGTVLGRTFVMGGANGDVAPFSGEITIEPPSSEVAVVVFSTSSAEDGTVQEATVVPIRVDPQVAAATTSFSVFFHRGEELVEVTRTVPRTTGVLRAALAALVAGPTQAEIDSGLGSLFSAETADVLAGVNLRDGTAVVDFAEVVNNASTAAGSVAFLASLDATIFQFATVERIEYRLQGSCDGFWSWLQRGGCVVVER